MFLLQKLCCRFLLVFSSLCAFQLAMNPFRCSLALSRLSPICLSRICFLFDCSMIVQVARLLRDCGWAAEVEGPENKQSSLLSQHFKKIQYILRKMCLWNHKDKQWYFVKLSFSIFQSNPSIPRCSMGTNWELSKEWRTCTHNGKVKFTNAVCLNIVDYFSLGGGCGCAVVYHLRFLNPFRHSAFRRT